MKMVTTPKFFDIQEHLYSCLYLKKKYHYVFISNFADYLDEGDPDYKCGHCGATMWYGERLNKRRNAKKPTFSLCCMQGQVQLPLLKEPPSVLKKLLEGDETYKTLQYGFFLHFSWWKS